MVNGQSKTTFNFSHLQFKRNYCTHPKLHRKIENDIGTLVYTTKLLLKSKSHGLCGAKERKLQYNERNFTTLIIYNKCDVQMIHQYVSLSFMYKVKSTIQLKKVK